MKFGPYSFEKGGGSKSGLRQLAIPALIAGTVSIGVAVFLSKRTRPDPEKPSEWTINWVELTDFKKQESQKPKEQNEKRR